MALNARQLAMKVVKRKAATFLQVHVLNPRIGRRAGDPGSRVALLETTGRKSGLLRQIPVGNGLQGDVFWIVAHHGRSAAWVRNLESNPRVKIKVGGRWRGGTAMPMPDDDPLERLASAYHPLTAARGRQLATDPLTIRVDLDPESC